ncbi:carbamoyltransferase HypF [Streptacidiphilus fuscans]|uniref:Carbamoyltransferase n=1 Tax=Streptacidiphilus fuscans TaxID=2789292 RepID=A0A931B213_9ACTN|nr:carbamoyltransferase HypF [Streptacidiphilus fuscans]MBF9068803.1 carbamoyltransferase HypF [Streptacidiphilus fuscans]
MTAPTTSPERPGREGSGDGVDGVDAGSGVVAGERRRVTVRGVVQGVGFRPFVFGLANELRLAGYVTNTGEGVVTEVEGAREAVAAFCVRIAADAPPLAVVESVSHESVAAAGETGFRIEASRSQGPRRTLVSPDTATCASCLAEMTDPGDRRHRHPFITCTHCGPRFTIVAGLPYDRANTTMARFPMCARCEREYTDPADRRFHAQPVACHDCGPTLRLLLAAEDGRPVVAPDRDPVAAARRLLAEGRILAVKGLGGYHLACDARNAASVALLRRRKNRGDKPFALMAAQLADVEPLVRIDDSERRLLTGNRRPIVLLRRRSDAASESIAAEVAPGSPDLGVMLPYTPLHHLLLGLPGDPPGPRLLVMTSGNLGGEPIVTDDEEVLTTLAPLVDAWLTHDRPIHVPCDDSVVRVVDGEELLVRRSRGYAPLPVTLAFPVRPTLAVGGDLKNAFCLGQERHAWLSAHIGDMDDLATLTAFGRAERQLESITGVTPTLLAADAHPGYRASGWARRHAGERSVRSVQHHHAHVAAVMAENGLDGTAPVLGVAFDGTGYGDDAAVWGGEFLLADYDGYRRLAHLAYVPLPGGDAAVRRPYRMALAHLFAAGLPWDDRLPCVAACPDDERSVLERQLQRGLASVPTSSAGRLFDAVSSLAGVCHQARYEGQAAIEWEAAAYAWLRDDGASGRGYRFGLVSPSGGGDAPLRLDPGPVLAAVAADVLAGAPAGLVAARFHTGLADAVRHVCATLRERTGVATVALSGGVFANALLAAGCARGLRDDGFTVLRHRLVPPNDGGLALGQLAVAAHVERHD